MEKVELEKIIFDKGNKEFFGFIENHFSYEKVKEEELQENLNTHEDLSALMKKVFISRLNSLDENYDQTSIITSMGVYIIALIAVYRGFVEGLDQSVWISIFFVFLLTTLCFLYITYEMGKAKAKRAKVKYYLTLFKDK